jgi:hypothetical protein
MEPTEAASVAGAGRAKVELRAEGARAFRLLRQEEAVDKGCHLSNGSISAKLTAQRHISKGYGGSQSSSGSDGKYAGDSKFASTTSCGSREFRRMRLAEKENGDASSGSSLMAQLIRERYVSRDRDGPQAKFLSVQSDMTDPDMPMLEIAQQRMSPSHTSSKLSSVPSDSGVSTQAEDSEAGSPADTAVKGRARRKAENRRALKNRFMSNSGCETPIVAADGDGASP